MAVLALALLAGCDVPEDPSEDEDSLLEPIVPMRDESVLYHCGIRAVRVTREGNDLVVVSDDAQLRLTPAEAASGVKFIDPANPQTLFWMKGEKAIFAVDGRQDPECAIADPELPAPTITAPFRARGSEPGWTLTIGAGAMRYIGDYGETDIMAPKPKPEAQGNTLVYRVKEPRLMVRITDQICTDAATGMPYPYRVQVGMAGKTVNGCGGEAQQLLGGAPWTVTEIAGESPVDGALVTLDFGEDGRIAGNGPCNTYSATFRLTGEGLSMGPVISTKKACEAPLMKQEQRFLDLVGRAVRFEILPDRTLRLLTDDTTTVSARRD